MVAFQLSRWINLTHLVHSPLSSNTLTTTSQAILVVDANYLSSISTNWQEEFWYILPVLE